MIIASSDIAERAAFLEFCCGMTRDNAEGRAITEACDRLHASMPPGILGELVVADRVRRELNGALEVSAATCRWPWGFGYVVPEGLHYRPAEPAEPATVAFIVPAVEDGRLADLAAQSLTPRGFRTRLGIAEILGADDVQVARDAGTPLYVFSSIPHWLRGGCRGAVILNWRRASTLLHGLSTILCNVASAPRLVDATSNCWPRPLVAVPADKEFQHAA